jgi:hypothetical protein
MNKKIKAGDAIYVEYAYGYEKGRVISICDNEALIKICYEIVFPLGDRKWYPRKKTLWERLFTYPINSN